ncbi:MAG: alpha-ketoacid dehydrogenase subunit beta, partial [Candidatus Omnitrophica bacterium]|nr:alpha-ketoacid dehydrogenase subunit beta [Candidatus Omnitrophota bacterium]
FIEHRWLHGIKGFVAEEAYAVPIGEAKKTREGKDVTIIASSYMTLEASRAAELLSHDDIDAEVLDLRTIKPLDESAIIRSIEKTHRVIVVEDAWQSFGVSAEILALISKKSWGTLKCAPCRLTFPDVPTPTSWALANHYYPKARDIVDSARTMFGLPLLSDKELGIFPDTPMDVPDKTFKGPF